MEDKAFWGRPWYQSYEVCRDFFAGEYAGDKYADRAEDKLKYMLEFGIKHFIDLTEEGELEPYAHLLPEGVTYKRFPITDVSVPNSVEQVHQLLETIDEYRSHLGKIYLHCWGGVGRTGTIVACYFAKHSSNPSVEEALAFLRKRFSKMPKSSCRVTPDTRQQEVFIGKYVEYVKQLKEKEKCELVRDSIRGSLMAGAAGDALGYTVEFMSRNYILSKYGGAGITLFELGKNGKALISDDTQMTLFTANGLLMGVTRLAMRGVGARPEQYVDGAYLDWYYTQTGKKRETGIDDCHYTWLRDLPEMAHRRAPGNTCLSACHALFLQEKVCNFSKGCGGIMRVAPIGLLEAAVTAQWPCSYSWKELAEAGAEIARVTHLHPLGFLPAALLAVLIKKLVLLTPAEAVRHMEELVNESLAVLDEMYIEESEEEFVADRYKKEKMLLKELTHKAISLAKSDLPDASAIQLLGEGWVADEAWAISLFCSMRHVESVRDAIIASVNHDGDSDSTGSITGNIMGAIHGYRAIKEQNLFCPEGHKLEDTLELSEIILALADDLYTICPHGAIDTPESQQWYERYCQMRPAGIGDCKMIEPEEML